METKNKTSLHVILRQYRVLQTFVVVSLVLFTHWMLEWVMEGKYSDLTEWQTVVVATTLPALVAGLFGLAKLFNSKTEVDEQDKNNKD